MSSWASIVNNSHNTNKRNKPVLLIKYNDIKSNSNTNTPSNDRIPRDREITPHPADDYMMTNGEVSPWGETAGFGQQHQTYYQSSRYNVKWVDYTKNDDLYLFKQSLPISIQRIIEFANKWLGYGEIMNLNFNEIDQDLKYQNMKYNGDQKKLKKIFFNYNPKNKTDWNYNIRSTEDYEERYCKLFGSRCYTVIHYLFNQMLFGKSRTSKKSNIEITECIKSKIIKQCLHVLKLLCLNNIIDINDTFSVNMGMSIWDNIKNQIRILSQYDEDIMNDLIDLMITAINQKPFNQQPAIISINMRKIKYDENDPYRGADYVRDRIYCQTLWDCEYFDIPDSIFDYLSRQIVNKYQLIEKLLFAQMIPFQFIQETRNSKYDIDTHQREWEIHMNRKQPIKGLKGYIEELFEENIYGNKDKDDGNKDKDDENKNEDEIMEDKYEYQFGTECVSKLSLLSPLILYPYLLRARKKMNDVLTDCMVNCDYIKSDHLSYEISNIISYYLFVDIYDIYDKTQIEENLNMKTLTFLNLFLHCGVNDEFMTQFEDKYCDAEFLKYLVNGNYSRTFSDMISSGNSVNYEFMNKFIIKYHEKCDELPFIKSEKDGIYSILDLMSVNCALDSTENLTQFTKLLIFIKNTYKDKFTINYKYDDGYSNTLTAKILRRTRYSGPRKTELAKKLINFILNEFKNEYDINNPCLLYLSLRGHHEDIFKYLIKKYNKIYSLERICKIMMKVVKDSISHQQRRRRGGFRDCEWRKWNVNGSKKFLKSIEEYLLFVKCKNNKEKKEMLQKNVAETWKCYSKILKKKHWEW